MSVITVNLCPESLAKLPRLGRSAYVRAAILAYREDSPAPPSDKSEGKPAFVRDGRRYLPAFKIGEMETFNGLKRHASPCTEAPHIKAWQGNAWFDYTGLWRWPDPFPGLVEWHAMGCPEKPLEAHRLPVELRGGVVEPEPQAVPPPIVHLATGAQCATLPDDI